MQEIVEAIKHLSLIVSITGLAIVIAIVGVSFQLHKRGDR